MSLMKDMYRVSVALERSLGGKLKSEDRRRLYHHISNEAKVAICKKIGPRNSDPDLGYLILSLHCLPNMKL